MAEEEITTSVDATEHNTKQEQSHRRQKPSTHRPSAEMGIHQVRSRQRRRRSPAPAEDENAQQQASGRLASGSRRRRGPRRLRRHTRSHSSGHAGPRRQRCDCFQFVDDDSLRGFRQSGHRKSHTIIPCTCGSHTCKKCIPYEVLW